MASPQESLSLQVITSPFLRNPERPRENSEYAASSDRREHRQSLERLERINMNDLQPIHSKSEPLRDGMLESDSSRLAKRQNRLSREILGMDDEVLAAPDRALPQPQGLSSEMRNNSVGDSTNHLSFDEDTSSVAFGGSIASTVPDRYGFLGGAQYSLDSEKYELLIICLKQCNTLLFSRETLQVHVVRRRELKWLQMLDEWDKYMTQKYKKVSQKAYLRIVDEWMFHLGTRPVPKRHS